jgi:hypothetical protein
MGVAENVLMFVRGLPFLAAFILPLAVAFESVATTLDFDILQHGEIVDTQFVDAFGVMIHAVNRGGGPDLALAFDSLRNETADPDLEGPPWCGGNLDRSTTLGRLLIIAENERDRNGDGIIDSPDDEGSRPAGSLVFDFQVPIVAFGFDLIDVEGPEEYGANRGFVAVFYDGDDTELARVGFGAFVDPHSPFFVEGVAFGNRTANRIPALTAEDLGIAEFQRVELNLGGSSAVDNISFEPIPEPATLVLVATGLALSSLIRSRKRGAHR